MTIFFNSTSFFVQLLLHLNEEETIVYNMEVLETLLKIQWLDHKNSNVDACLT